MRSRIRLSVITPLVVLSLIGASADTAFAGWQTPNWSGVPVPDWDGMPNVGPIQQPGEIEVPKGPWQVPKGIQAIKAEERKCVRRISVVADALFDFDKATLRGDAEETLAAAGPQITAAGKGKVTVNGHTDAIGTDVYNDKLSEARARTVRDWLVDHDFIPLGSEIKGFGKRQPVAPNTYADGRDNPEGRQKNRRVEIDVDTCG